MSSCTMPTYGDHNAELRHQTYIRVLVVQMPRRAARRLHSRFTSKFVHEGSTQIHAHRRLRRDDAPHRVRVHKCTYSMR